MDEFMGWLLTVWIVVATVGAVDNLVAQTPDKRIITQCKENGYITVNQTVVSCSIEKEIKK